MGELCKPWTTNAERAVASRSSKLPAHNNNCRPCKPHSKGTVEALVDAYLDSQDFLALRERTRADYQKLTRAIVKEFGDMPIKAVAHKGARGEYSLGETGSPSDRATKPITPQRTAAKST